jgi:hypothetical protein
MSDAHLKALSILAIPVALTAAALITAAIAFAPAPDRPGVSYVPCSWFTTGHTIPAHASRIRCDTGEGLTEVAGLNP